MLYTDTDSLILNIQTDNFYEDIKENLSLFDTSNYLPENIHDIIPNQSRLGKMKDEYGGKVVKSFYGTGAKAYCVILGEKLDFYLNYIKPNYINNATIVQSNNESIIIKLNTDNSSSNKQSIVKQLTQHFPTNINIEVLDKINNDFTIKITDSVTKKAKGVKRSVIRQDLKVEDYEEVIRQDKILFRKMKIFKSNLHVMYTQMKNKVALSPKDDKRYILSGSSRTLALGHYIIDNKDNKLEELISLADFFYINDTNTEDDLVTLLDVEIKRNNVSEDVLNKIYKSLIATL